MTIKKNNLVGGGRSPGLRSPGGGGRIWILCLTLGLVASALPAWAAEIVEVRIGRHPEFTRVVFELDRATGYRIDRSDPSTDVAELVVSLEASSIPRSIQSKKSLIENVEVESVGSRSIARVRLAKDGLRLKEMILTNPPRIVLDVLVEESVAQAPAPKAEESSGSGDDEVFDEILAQIPVETSPEEAAPEESTPEEAEVFFADEPSISTPIEEIAEAVPAPTPIVPVPTAKPAAPRPMVAKTTPSQDGTNWALVAGGALVFLLGGAFIVRRRGEDGGYDAEDDDAFDSYAGEETVIAPVDENPFNEFSNDGDAEPLYGAPDDVTVEPMVNEGDATIVSSSQGLGADEEKESESVVFDDTEETVMDDMEVISREQVNESLGGEMPSAMGAAVPDEFQQMMAEMSRRMEALESRCDELVDARDRLERQVAAQTEELRVQRAAIARTQRAVRNLGRPEDEEQEATEPALRDPNQPSSD